MTTTARRFFVQIMAVALLAVACSAEPTLDVAAPPDEPTPTLDPTPVFEPTPVPEAVTEPTPTPEPTAAPQTPAEPPQFAGQRPEAFVAPQQWQETFTLDPAVREGVLSNGLRYLIRNNGRPGAQAQLRLVVHAGSLNEEPGNFGSAHFLEHMMFNGTEQYPGNELIPVLESFGAAFGPDINAYTSFEETVYELEVPARTGDTVQLALDVLYQWATAATITEEDVVAERGVVREEYRRSEESVGGRIGTEIREVLFGGTDYLGREPIGDIDVINDMSAPALRAFYERWYRPELMTVIVVGDINVDDIEARIADTFVQPASDPAVDRLTIDVGDGPFPEPVFDIVTDSELNQTEVEVLWRVPTARATTTPSALRDSIIGAVAFDVLNNRFFEQVQGGESVFVSANAGSGSLVPGLDLASFNGQADPDQADAGLAEMLTLIEGARQHSITEAELGRSLESIANFVEQEYSQRDTRQDGALAGELIDYALGRTIPPTAEQARDIAQEVLDSIRVDDVQGYLFDVLDSNPYVLITAPAAAETDLPAPEELAETYDRVVGAVIEADDSVETTLDELMAAPEPSEVIATSRIDALNTTVVTFENGARLAYRPTAITENVVFMRGVSPGGYFAVEGPEVPLLDRSIDLVQGSGFESVGPVELDRFLASSIVSMSTGIGRTEEIIDADAATEDLETLFQLVHLQMTEPTISDVQIRAFDEFWRPLAENPASRPTTAARLELWRLRYGDSPWFRFLPTLDDLDTLDPDLLLDAYKQRFANAGDFVFVVVGDFDADELVDLGARYLGTLPDNGVREDAIDRDPGVPEENLVATVNAGVGDQGSVRINWESPYPFTNEATVAAQVLEVIVNARLRDLIREELGASYSPNAAVTVLSEPKPWVDTIISVESDPERIEEVSDVIRAELERIRAGELDEQYLELAVDQLVEEYRFFSNEAWIGLIAFHIAYPDRPADEYQDRSSIAESLTVADIAEVAQQVFPPSRSVEVRLLPAG